jgi:hypothetical protein
VSGDDLEAVPDGAADLGNQAAEFARVFEVCKAAPVPALVCAVGILGYQHRGRLAGLWTRIARRGR